MITPTNIQGGPQKCTKDFGLLVIKGAENSFFVCVTSNLKSSACVSELSEKGCPKYISAMAYL